nr:Chain A, prion protein [Homo sapiens]7N2L_A Chain A, prion protein [synthetic construct]7RVH_A Chain A, Major prion protein [Myodes glareolus]
QYNNENNFV